MCLVTGGAGFIGSNLCDALLKHGEEVVCLDNFNDYYNPRIKYSNVEPFLSNPAFRLIEGDILNEKTLINILQDVDYVFHSAAQAGVRISVNDPKKPHEINATGTLSLLEASLNSGIKKS